jgi:hypothetical protein
VISRLEGLALENALRYAIEPIDFNATGELCGFLSLIGQIPTIESSSLLFTEKEDDHTMHLLDLRNPPQNGNKATPRRDMRPFYPVL